MNEASRPRDFRPDIEGLRGVAILLVVAYHAAVPGCTGGYIGVDVFYVLSGYLISGLILAELDATKSLSFRGFYARRVRRLLPAAFLTTTVTLVLVVALLSPIETLRIAKTAQSVAIYISNLRFARGSVDYLGASHDVDPLLHTWSLGVEEQFYFVWPLLLFLVFRAGRRRAVMGTMAFVSVASFALCVVLTRKIQPWAFYGTPARFWEFAIGALAAMAPVARIRAVSMVSLAGLTAIVASALVFDSYTPFPGYTAAVPVLGTAALLYIGAVAPTEPVVRTLGHPALTWIGRHSYSWYLWHWPFVVLVRAVKPDASWPVLVAASAGALVAAMVTLRVIEDPARRSAALRSRPMATIGIGLLLAVAGLAAGQLVASYAHRELATPVQARYVAAKSDRPRLYADDCAVSLLDSKLTKPCRYGDASSQTVVVLFGDSHAAQWFPAVDAIARAHHWALLVRIKVSCPPIGAPGIYAEKLRRDYAECSAWTKQTVDEILALKPAAVIMSASSAYVSDTQAHRTPTTSWISALGKTVGNLVAAKIPTIWISDTPHPTVDVPLCLSRRAATWFSGDDCTFPQPSRSLAAREHQAVSDAGGLAIDVDDELCPTSRCEVEHGDVVVYSDANHVSATRSLQLVPRLERELAPYIGAAR